VIGHTNWVSLWHMAHGTAANHSADRVRQMRLGHTMLG